MKARLTSPLVAGILLLLLGTLMGSLADGAVKHLALRFEAPQVFGVSGLIMAGLCLMAAWAGAKVGMFSTSCLTTKAPVLLLLRSLATLGASVGFFYAFDRIPMAEVFVFVGLMPLISALLSRLVLQEEITLAAWVGLGLGLLGVMMLFQGRFAADSIGHLAGLFGAFMGTVSLVLARKMARVENNSLVQVFYPNLALALAALVVLPAVWRPMGLGDLAMILVYSALLFVARWSLVLVMRRLPAQVVLPLMNFQFVWMIAVGFAFFGELPGLAVLLGAAMVMLAGMIALTQQARVERLARAASMAALRPKVAVIPAE